MRVTVSASLERKIEIEYIVTAIATTIVTTTVAGPGAGRAEPGVWRTPEKAIARFCGLIAQMESRIQSHVNQ